MKERFAVPFTRLKNAVLPRHYDLSLVFVNDAFSRRLNATYCGKHHSADILSFPLSKKHGEIFIDLVTAQRESKKFGLSFRKFVTLLFIHGLLHLKGMRHGITMERVEKKLLHGASNRNRH